LEARNFALLIQFVRSAMRFYVTKWLCFFPFFCHQVFRIACPMANRRRHSARSVTLLLTLLLAILLIVLYIFSTRLNSRPSFPRTHLITHVSTLAD
jgi:hypothetical protein